MGYLTRASKHKDNDTVGRFKPDARCKKHSKHRQSPGVCSLCLRERLTQLSVPSSRTPSSAMSSSSSSSLSSYHSSTSASSSASPMHHFSFTTDARTASGSSMVSIVLLNGKLELIKSRSTAVGNNTRDKRSGFWYRLLHPSL